jgi:hypothetical protein
MPEHAFVDKLYITSKAIDSEGDISGLIKRSSRGRLLFQAD